MIILRNYYVPILLLVLSINAHAEEKIIGGQRIAAHEDIAKVIVGIRFIDIKKRILGTCSGTILTENLIVTAAHCVHSNGLTVRPQDIIITYGLNMLEMGPAGKVDHIMISKYYAENIQGIDISDLAILKLRGKITEPFRPAKVLDNYHEIQPGNVVTLAGYGKTNFQTGEGIGVLHKVDLVVSTLFNEEFIALAQGRSGCQGDSGGPAFLKSDTDLTYTGVTSRVTIGCSYNTFITYIQKMNSFFFDAIDELFELNKLDTKSLSWSSINNFYALAEEPNTRTSNRSWEGHCYDKDGVLPNSVQFSLDANITNHSVRFFGKHLVVKNSDSQLNCFAKIMEE